MARILIVEDDKDLNRSICQVLNFENYNVEAAMEGTAAYLLLKTQEFDLIILDWDIPNIDGIEICRRYRSNGGKAPVLMLTGKSETVNKIKGLDSGADDYLVKPFDPDELLARIRALLRRGETNTVGNCLVVGDLTLDTQTYEVKKNGTLVKLIPKEFAILELLMRYRGKVFKPEAIIDRIWTAEDSPAPDVVRTHVMNLRKKLGEESLIQTVHGIGYKIS